MSTHRTLLPRLPGLPACVARLQAPYLAWVLDTRVSPKADFISSLVTEELVTEMIQRTQKCAADVSFRLDIPRLSQGMIFSPR